MPAGVISKHSRWPVQETVARLRATTESGGGKIFATIDQRAEAQAVGLSLRETVLIVFGNPRAGTAVMDAEPLAALDVPLKLLVWSDGEQTVVSYTSAAELAERYGLSSELAGPLGASDAITTAALRD